MKTFLLVAVAILTLSTLIKANNISTGAEQAYIDSIKASNLKLSKQIDSITVHDQEQSEINNNNNNNNNNKIKDDMIMIVVFLLLMFALYKKNKQLQNNDEVKDKKFLKGVFVFVFLVILLFLTRLTIDLFHLLSM